MAIKSNIKPLFDNVLVKPVAADTQTVSGIYLPESAKEKPQLCEIIAVGPGKVHPKGEQEVMVVKVGQKVYVKQWGGDTIKVGHEEWKIVSQHDILAIVE